MSHLDSKDPRPSEESETIPGYLSKFALVNVAIEGANFVVTGEPGAVVANVADSKDLYVNVLRVPPTSLVEIANEAARSGSGPPLGGISRGAGDEPSMQEKRDEPNEQANRPESEAAGEGPTDVPDLDETGQPSTNLFLTGDSSSPTKLPGVLVASTHPDERGGFRISFPIVRLDPLVIFISGAGDQDFALIQNTDDPYIISMLYDPAGRLPTSRVTIEIIKSNAEIVDSEPIASREAPALNSEVPEKKPIESRPDGGDSGPDDADNPGDTDNSAE